MGGDEDAREAADKAEELNGSNGEVKTEEKSINQMSAEEIEKQIQEKLPGIFKLKEKKWREYVVRDYNSLAQIIIGTQAIVVIGNKNFAVVSKWMKEINGRMKEIEEKLAFLEVVKKDGDEKAKKYVE